MCIDIGKYFVKKTAINMMCTSTKGKQTCHETGALQHLENSSTNWLALSPPIRRLSVHHAVNHTTVMLLQPAAIHAKNWKHGR